MELPKPTRSVEICANIISVTTTEHAGEIESHVRKGAVLLGVANSPYGEEEDESTLFRFCLGWPKSSGEVPEWFYEIR